jgi:aminomethyltransferase
VNASRIEADLAWMEPRLCPETEIMEQPQPAALALQGPAASSIMEKIAPDAVQLARNDVAEFPIQDMELVVARTGYTGEDGFEVFGPAGHVFPFYQGLLKAGEAHGLALCGLGARDTLRLEMGYRLYGHDMDESHTALEAGLGWVVKFDKPDFIGREALLKEKAAGSARRLIGFRLKERGVPREGGLLSCEGREIGRVTSGTFSPSLQIGIGLGYVDSVLFPKGAEDAHPLSLTLHGRPVPAEIAAPPFYKK